MRISKLPPVVIDRLDVVARHADACARAATLADTELAKTRATLRGDFAKTGNMRTDRQTVEAAQRDFNSILESSQERRRRSDASRRVANACKQYVDQLPDAAVIELVSAPKANGADLSECRSRIGLIRAELNKINNLPQPFSRAHWENYVAELGRAARPLISAQGVSWPMAAGAMRTNGAGFDDRDANALLMEAALRPGPLVDYLVAEDAERCGAVMPGGERPGKIAELEGQLEQLQALEVQFVNVRIERGDIEVVHSPETPAALVLGIVAAESQRSGANLPVMSFTG